MPARTESPAAGRWSRRKEARPGEILDAAVAVFAEKGFAAARMEDIAKRAGVTKGTIYLYFPSKHDIFKSLVRDTLGATITDVSANAQTFEGSSSDLIQTILRAVGHLLNTSDRVVLPKIIIAEAGNFPELARFYREEIVDKGLGMITGAIERGIARGEFRKLPADHVARLCIAPILLSVIWRTSFSKFDKVPFDYPAFVETHLDVLLKGLAANGDSP
jgi:AcrR family transcriptional regulator